MANKKQYVYVVQNSWKDRHGEEGFGVPRVTNSLKKARKAMSEDVVEYLKLFEGAVDEDGVIDSNVINEVNGEQVEKQTLDSVVKDVLENDSYEVNIDSEGTYSTWEITRVEVE
jgi:hypothetical protein